MNQKEATKSIVTLFLILLLLPYSVNAEIIENRTSGTLRRYDTETKTGVLSLTQSKYMLDEYGNWVDWNNIISSQWTNDPEEGIIEYTKINNYSFSLQFLARRISDGEIFTIAQVKTAYPQVTTSEFLQVGEYGHKHYINISDIPEEVLADYDMILRLRDHQGLNWSDVRRKGSTLIIKEELELRFKDLLDNRFTLTPENKTFWRIGNISANAKDHVVSLDPVLALITGSGLEVDVHADRVGGGNMPAYKFSGLDAIGGGQVINNATFTFDVHATFGGGFTSLAQINRLDQGSFQNWTEQECKDAGGTFIIDMDSNTSINRTESWVPAIFGVGQHGINAGEAVDTEYQAGNNNVSFIFNIDGSSNDYLGCGQTGEGLVLSVSGANGVKITDSTLANGRPKPELNITFSAAPVVGEILQVNITAPLPDINTTNTTIVIQYLPNSSIGFANTTAVVQNTTDNFQIRELNKSTIENNTVNSIEVNITQDGVYTVFIDIWNNASNALQAFSLNQTLRRDTTPPVPIDVTSPINSTLVAPVWFNLTAVDATSGIGSCWYSLDGGSNVSLTNSTGNWNSLVFPGVGSHNVEFFCNDTAGNINASVPVVFFTVPLEISLQAPGNEALLFGLPVDHIYNVTCSPGCANSSLLINNQTVLLDTSVTSGVNNTLSLTHNNTGVFNWTVEVCTTDGNCLNATNGEFNYTIIPANFSIQLFYEFNETNIDSVLEVRIRDPNSFALLQAVNTDSNGIATVNLTLGQVVIEAGFLSGSTLLNRRIFKTLVITDDFDPLDDNLALINGTGFGSINMFLPAPDNDVLLQTFILNDVTTNSDFSPANETILRIRKVINGTDVIMHQDFFDVESKLPAFLLADNKYKLTIESVAGGVRDLGFKVPSISGDEIILDVETEGVDRSVWVDTKDTATGSCTFNNVTLLLTCTFVDTAGKLTHSTLSVWKYAPLNYTLIHNNTITGSNNVHTFTLPDNSTEYFFALTVGSSPDDLVLSSGYLLGLGFESPFGMTGLISSGFFIGGAGLIGSFNPTASVVFVVIGFIVLIMFKVLSVTSIGTVTSLAIMASYIAWRLRKK